MTPVKRSLTRKETWIIPRLPHPTNAMMSSLLMKVNKAIHQDTKSWRDFQLPSSLLEMAANIAGNNGYNSNKGTRREGHYAFKRAQPPTV